VTSITPPPVVLASQSAARAALLTGAGVSFACQGAGVDEAAVKAELIAQSAGPREIALALAEAKAVAVSVRTPGLVIGADQTLDLDGRLFDKPRDPGEAREHLLALRGRTHQLHAALAVAESGEVIWRLTESPSLTMRAFSDAFLADYLAAHGQAILSSVGGYQLERPGIQLFERIEGDYFAILGLPLLPLLALLRARGVLTA